MTQPEIAQPALYCRRCGYALVGLSANRCPECGRPFDPTDRRTFTRYPHSGLVRYWIRKIVLGLTIVLLAGAILASAWFGWVYWTYRAEWQAEQEAIAALKASADDAWQVTVDTWYVPFGWEYSLPFCPDYLLTRVWMVAVRGDSPWQASLSGLASFKHCRSITLPRLGIADDHLRHLEGLTRLEWLDLEWNPAVTDDGLVHLRGLTSLRELHLQYTSVSGAGLRHLQGLTRLTYLTLAGTRVQDGDLAALTAFPFLSILVLDELPIADADLVHLKALPLTQLWLNQTRITDTGLVEVGQMPRLECLLLADTSITDAGLQHLSRLSNLDYLNLDNTAVTDAGLKHLESLARLKRLSAYGTKVTPEGIRQLKQVFPSLHVVGP